MTSATRRPRKDAKGSWPTSNKSSAIPNGGRHYFLIRHQRLRLLPNPIPVSAKRTLQPVTTLRPRPDGGKVFLGSRGGTGPDKGWFAVRSIPPNLSRPSFPDC